MAQQQLNAAYYYVTGPVHIYVRIPTTGAGPQRLPNVAAGSGTIFTLGHCEDSPEPDFVPHYLPVKSSLAGPALPDDEIQAGGEVKVELLLSRFNLTLVNRLKQMARHGRDQPPGFESFLDRGRLLLAQGDSFELWLANAFYGTPNAAAYPDLSPGYYFPACRLAGTLPRNLSRDAKKVHLSVEPKSVRLGVAGGFMTYSQDPKWFKILPPPG